MRAPWHFVLARAVYHRSFWFNQNGDKSPDYEQRGRTTDNGETISYAAGISCNVHAFPLGSLKLVHLMPPGIFDDLAHRDAPPDQRRVSRDDIRHDQMQPLHRSRLHLRNIAHPGSDDD